MTVAELIEQLRLFPPTHRILVWDPYWDIATEGVTLGGWIGDNTVLISSIDLSTPVKSRA